MKTSAITIFVSIFIIQTGFSQNVTSSKKNSFYHKKRGLVEVGLNPRLCLISIQGEGVSKINVGSWAEYTFAFTNSVSTTLNVGRNTYFRESLVWVSESDPEFNRRYRISEGGKIKAINTNRVGIRINKALTNKKGAIAPMGHYIGLGYQLFLNSLDYKDEPMIKYYKSPVPENKDRIIVTENGYLDKPVKFNTWAIELYYGARLNISKMVFVSWSVTTALNSYLALFDEERYYYYTNSFEYRRQFSDITAEELISSSRYQMQANNFFNFRFGIGMIIH